VRAIRATEGTRGTGVGIRAERKQDHFLANEQCRVHSDQHCGDVWRGAWGLVGAKGATEVGPVFWNVETEQRVQGVAERFLTC
jgi:hypothetical protein